MSNIWALSRWLRMSEGTWRADPVERPLTALQLRRKSLSEWIYREAQNGTLDPGMAQRFPIAANGGDIERDYANYARAVLKQVLLTLLEIAAVVAVGLAWILS